MSNKSWERLWECDRRLQRMFPTEMWGNEIICKIEMIGGFELFNTRPYHNYETWSSGYRITTGNRYGSLIVEAEDLDDAIRMMEAKLQEWRHERQEQVAEAGPQAQQEQDAGV